MTWAEKEERYSRQYAAGKVSTNLWKYIPYKHWRGIFNAYSDADGYWITLDSTYTAYDGGEDCGIIHEYTIADIKDAIKTIRRKEEKTA